MQTYVIFGVVVFYNISGQFERGISAILLSICAFCYMLEERGKLIQ